MPGSISDSPFAKIHASAYSITGSPDASEGLSEVVQRAGFNRLAEVREAIDDIADVLVRSGADIETAGVFVSGVYGLIDKAMATEPVSEGVS